MPLFLFFLAAAAGLMLPLQAVVNASLGRVIGGPLWAAALSSVVYWPLSRWPQGSLG